MKIWDSGTFEIRKASGIAQALAKGELKLEMKGSRLRGEWHLVQTRQEAGKNWLLFKAKDRYAGSGSDLFGGADVSRASRRPPPRTVARMEATAGDAPSGTRTGSSSRTSSDAAYWFEYRNPRSA